MDPLLTLVVTVLVVGPVLVWGASRLHLRFGAGRDESGRASDPGAAQGTRC